MARKIENWIEEVFPGEKNINSQFEQLSTREFIISISASLDLALVQLLSLRLIDNNKEKEDFLGLYGDGRAPCGTFGSRIQLSLLLGIISQEDADILRVIKSLRNLYAHSINVNLSNGEGLKLLNKLFDQYKNIFRRLRGTNDSEELTKIYNDINKWFTEDEITSKQIINNVFSIYQIYFHRQLNKIKRIEIQSDTSFKIVQGPEKNNK